MIRGWSFGHLDLQKLRGEGADLEFVKSFTPVRFQKNSILPEKKRVNHGIFGQESQMDDVLLIDFEQVVSFCAFTDLTSLSLNNSLTCPEMFVDWLNVMDAWSGVFGNSVVQ